MTSADRLPDNALAGLAAGSVPPGLHRWPPATAVSGREEALGAASAAGWYGAGLELEGTRDKETFLRRCAEGLSLPAWFGWNWDALYDCLTDLSWWTVPDRPPAGYLIVAGGWHGFEKAAPEVSGTAACILEDAVAHWRKRNTPLAVLLG
ncbi:hypothetical protein GCM10009716_28520 [Streptomyces sodiiphilus]|uniref:Barstar (barnase inhibitor) domain-containing protein n=1 Tax=Streptomyces sodiiphilus TaxID=226217 RepID=A0ABN2PC69_9ACTN